MFLLLTTYFLKKHIERAQIRGPFDGKIIPLKTTKPLPSKVEFPVHWQAA
jgi:hypothetical protein